MVNFVLYDDLLYNYKLQYLQKQKDIILTNTFPIIESLNFKNINENQHILTNYLQFLGFYPQQDYFEIFVDFEMSHFIKLNPQKIETIMIKKLGQKLIYNFSRTTKWHQKHDRIVLAIKKKGQAIVIGDGQLSHTLQNAKSHAKNLKQKMKKVSSNMYWGLASQIDKDQSFKLMQKQRGLYQILPINKTLNKSILSMAYTPGVGTVCKQIEKNPALADQLTMRGRSVAIITQGNCFSSQKIEPGKMTPILDWCIAQIKYYAGVDSFPFIIRPKANMTSVLSDLSNTYGAILLLDPGITFDQSKLPKDFAIIRQQDIMKLNKKSVTDCQDTAKILAYVLESKKRGVIGQNLLKQGLKHLPHTLRKQATYFTLYRDDRTIGEKSYEFHRRFQGKIHIELNFDNIYQLRKCFTEKNLIEFAKNKMRKNGYQNLSTIVTDGTAILGFGDIGPKAGLPVMQGKSLLFKVLGGVNVVPVCISKRKTHTETVQAILDIASYFKAINLQDIKAPQCFYIQRDIKSQKILPVFHDDQHGTSIVTLAALINALKLANKKIGQVKIVITGVGAAGITICKLLINYGAKEIIMLDTKGAIYEGRKEGMNLEKEVISKLTNPAKAKGMIGEIIKGADVFIGVSGPGTLNKQHVKLMKEKPIIFALANPDPEIPLKDALEGGAFIYGSGRSDFKNQINNSLVFPGIFRGIHQHDLPQITEDMKLFVAELIANNIDQPPNSKHIIVDSLDMDIPVLIANGLERFKKMGGGGKDKEEGKKQKIQGEQEREMEMSVARTEEEIKSKNR